MVPERLEVGLPDLAHLVLRDRADLETLGEPMVREVLHGRSNHLGGVRDRFVAGGAVECGRSLVAVVDPNLVELLGDIVARRDLGETALVPGEERAADSAAAMLRIDEADVPVDARAVGLLVPPDTAVRDRKSVHLGDQEIARRVAAVEMVVG
jgi:hypothetical protein